jgi:AraC-like DNA-binding protein
MTPRSKSMTAGCSDADERTVAVTATRALLDFAASKTGNRTLLFERSGLELADLLDENKPIPLPRFVALMDAGKELCNDPAFALHFGESDEFIEISFGCMMSAFSPTGTEVFARVNEGAPLMTDRFQMIRNGDGMWIVDTRNYDFPEGTESSFARTVCASRRLFPATELVKTVHFTHAEPPYRAEYDRIFRMPIVFGSDRNALLMDAAWLEQKPQELSRRVLEMMKTRAAAQAASTRQRVEALLVSLLQTADVSIDGVASRLGMGRHTLFRKLRAEGVTFRQVRDELRRKLAIQYLSERKLAVSETAYLLGFSDPAAFSRAYKRWTGHHPRGAR